MIKDPGSHRSINYNSCLTLCRALYIATCNNFTHPPYLPPLQSAVAECGQRVEELEGRLTQEEVHRQLAENEVETLRHSLHHELEIKEDTQEKMEEVRTHTHTALPMYMTRTCIYMHNIIVIYVHCVCFPDYNTDTLCVVVCFLLCSSMRRRRKWRGR